MTVRESAARRRVVRIRTLHPVPAPVSPAPDPDPPTGSDVPGPRRPRPPVPSRPPRPNRRPRPAGVPRRSAVLLVAVLVVALAGLAWAGQRWNAQRRLDAAHAAAIEAARQTTVDFVTISADTVDRDLQRIAAGATGDFKDEFTRGMAQVRAAVVENKVASTGSVLRAALVSGDLDSAVVLVAVDASVKNTGAPDGRISHYRIQVDLALDPGPDRWLVSRLQFVG